MFEIKQKKMAQLLGVEGGDGRREGEDISFNVNAMWLALEEKEGIFS